MRGVANRIRNVYRIFHRILRTNPYLPGKRCLRATLDDHAEDGKGSGFASKSQKADPLTKDANVYWGLRFAGKVSLCNSSLQGNCLFAALGHRRGVTAVRSAPRPTPSSDTLFEGGASIEVLPAHPRMVREREEYCFGKLDKRRSAPTVFVADSYFRAVGTC